MLGKDCFAISSQFSTPEYFLLAYYELAPELGVTQSR